MSTVPRPLLEVRYYQAAQEYLRNLPLEHFMEATPQATQRKITLESFDLIQARWPRFQHFNELLVQYPREGTRKPGQVVPDNMVVLHDEPIKAEGSYDVPLQPVPPFWVLEYVSKSNRRKDYEDSMYKYEHELKVPYYLLFVPDEQEVTLYRHTGEKFVSVMPDLQGRYALADVGIELALLDGWVRYWFRGELLPLPADLQRDLDRARAQLAAVKEQLGEAQRRLGQAEQLANEALQRAEEERQARLAAERELAELRKRLSSSD